MEAFHCLYCSIEKMTAFWVFSLVLGHALISPFSLQPLRSSSLSPQSASLSSKATLDSWSSNLNGVDAYLAEPKKKGDKKKETKKNKKDTKKDKRKGKGKGKGKDNDFPNVHIDVNQMADKMLSTWTIIVIVFLLIVVCGPLLIIGLCVFCGLCCFANMNGDNGGPRNRGGGGARSSRSIKGKSFKAKSVKSRPRSGIKSSKGKSSKGIKSSKG